MRHSQKLKELERRRRRGARLLAGGESQAEVARRVGVSRQTVMRWDRARQEGGTEALRRAPHFGRPERLSAAQRQELVRLLKDGTLAAGFSTELWTAPRIAQLIETKVALEKVLASVAGSSAPGNAGCNRCRRQQLMSNFPWAPRFTSFPASLSTARAMVCRRPKRTAVPPIGPR